MSKDTSRWGGVFLPSRRLLLGVAGGLLLLYTLLGFFVVPRIIRGQIVNGAREQLQRDAQVADVRFNPFTLAATVTGLRLADRDGADLLTVDRIHVNADTFGIFRWALRFSEIRIDKPVVSARLMGNGQPSVADLLEGQSSGEPFEMPRLIIDRLLMAGGVVQFSDASRQPVYQSRFEPLNLDVTHLVTLPQEGGEHAVTIGIGQETQLKWSGRQTVEPLRFTGRLDVTGLDLHSLWEYFARQGPLDLREGRADISLPYEIRRGASASLEVTLKDASVRAKTVAVRPWDGMTDWLTVPDVRVDGVNVAWPAARAEVTRIVVSEPRVLAQLEEDGRWNWQRAVSDAPPAPQPESSWTYRVGSIEVERGVARVEQPAAPDADAIELADVSISVKNVTHDLSAPFAFTSKARVHEAGSIEASGTVAPAPIALDVAFKAAGLDLLALQPYMTRPVAASISAGTASIEGKASMSPAQALTAAADLTLAGVELSDEAGEKLAAWRNMAVNGFTLEMAHNRARIRAVTVDEPYAKIHIDKQGYLNLSRLAAQPAPRPAAADRTIAAVSPEPDTAATSGSRPSPAAAEQTSARKETTAADSAAPAPRPTGGNGRTTVEVGVVQLRDGKVDFTDESLPLGTFAALIHSANGTIRDLSTFAAAPATMAIEGRVDKTGHVKVDGTLRTADPLAASDVLVSFRSIEMVGLTPYFAQFAGYRVQKGVLDLDVDYKVQARRLVGNHKVVAHDLVLGERVKDSKGPGFAVRLAVALLKDRQGRINIEVPVEGTVDDPQFNYRTVFWDAMKTILGNAAKAPFRALGRLFGRDEEDLELVEFDAGRSELLPADQEMLTRLGEQLAQRDGLSIEVEGRFDAKADPPAMKRARLEQLIEARRPAATAATAPGSSALETILEGLFTEQFSAEALAAERQKFTTSPAAGVTTPAAGAPTAGLAAPPTPSPTPTPTPAAPAPAPAPAAATSAPQTASATPGFDASGFYESLRQKLLEAQPVSQADLNALGTARAAAIVAVVSKAGTVDAARIKTSEPAGVKRSKKGSSRIASEMKMSGGDEPED